MDLALQLGLHAHHALADKLEAVLVRLIHDLLPAQLLADALELPVNVLVHLEHFLVAVGVRVPEGDVAAQLGDLLLLRQLIAVHRVVLAAASLADHRSKRRAKRRSRHRCRRIDRSGASAPACQLTETGKRAEGRADDARGQTGFRYAGAALLFVDFHGMCPFRF